MNSNQIIVTLSYDDLVSACKQVGNDDSSTDMGMDDIIDRAFGSTSPNSLGIIAITGIPNLSALRLKLLPLAEKIATLPARELEQITAHEAAYQVGWSHGREKLEGDKPDFSKGSFYANPLTDNLVETMLERRKYLEETNASRENGVKQLLEWDASIQSVPSDGDMQQLAKSNPAFFAPNIWPNESIPELETTFKEAGELVHHIGTMIAKCCDDYVLSRVSSTLPSISWTFSTLERVIVTRFIFFCYCSARDTIVIGLKISYVIQNAARHVFFITLQWTLSAVAMRKMMTPTLAIGAVGTMIMVPSQGSSQRCTLKTDVS